MYIVVPMSNCLHEEYVLCVCKLTIAIAWRMNTLLYINRLNRFQLKVKHVQVCKVHWICTYFSNVVIISFRHFFDLSQFFLAIHQFMKAELSLQIFQLTSGKRLTAHERKMLSWEKIIVIIQF